LKKKKKKRRRRGGVDEGSYVCPSCGETIVIPVDVSGGEEQRYVEDCPVCCNANVIHVEVMEGEARVWAEGE
jgi:transcription elongation factor Elf1